MEEKYVELELDDSINFELLNRPILGCTFEDLLVEFRKTKKSTKLLEEYVLRPNPDFKEFNGYGESWLLPDHTFIEFLLECYPGPVKGTYEVEYRNFVLWLWEKVPSLKNHRSVLIRLNY